MTFEAVSNGLLEWGVRIIGGLWLLGAAVQLIGIRQEMKLDAGATAPRGGIERDNAARRGWIAGKAVVVAVTAASMLALSRFAAPMAALLVIVEGLYLIWREYTARRASTPEAAAHARPSKPTIKAGYWAFAVACLIWAAAFRGVLH